MSTLATNGVYTQIESSFDSNSIISEPLLPGSVITVITEPIPSEIDTNPIRRSAYPMLLLSRDKQISVGEGIMKMILLDVKVKGGYSECLAHGKKLKYLEQLYLSAFLDDGMFNYIARPSQGKWKASFKAAFDVLVSLVTGHSHSPGNAAEGEDYPPHLKELISLFKQVTKKDPTETTNISAKKYAFRTRQLDLVLQLVRIRTL